jgi:hypothetical protein
VNLDLVAGLEREEMQDKMLLRGPEREEVQEKTSCISLHHSLVVSRGYLCLLRG